MAHLSDIELRELLQRVDYPHGNSPRDRLEVHLEVCEDCSKRLSEMAKFHEEMYEQKEVMNDEV